jgi:hypothetical protein
MPIESTSERLWVVALRVGGIAYGADFRGTERLQGSAETMHCVTVSDRS